MLVKHSLDVSNPANPANKMTGRNLKLWCCESKKVDLRINEKIITMIQKNFGDYSFV